MICTITHSRILFEYLNPKEEYILIEDIAHSLSQICRFTGHTSSFYSVAQHSVFVSRAVSPQNGLWGLLHDAPEAYVNDLSSPLKQIVDGNYDHIHNLIMGSICRKWNLPLDEPDEVKEFDHIFMVNELRALIDPSFKEENIPLFSGKLICLPPTAAKTAFLRRFNELKNR